MISKLNDFFLYFAACAEYPFSTQIIIAALNEEKEIGLTKINGASYFATLSVAVRTIFTNRITNVFEVQSGSKN